MGKNRNERRARPPYRQRPAQPPTGPPPAPSTLHPPVGPSASPQSSNHRPIGDILHLSNLRHEDILRIEEALHASDQKIQDADQRLGKKIYETRVLEEALSKTQQALSKSQKVVQRRTEELKAKKAPFTDLPERKELEAQIQDLQEQKQLQDGLLRMAGKEIKMRMAEVEDLKTEGAQLLGQVQDAEIEKAELRDQIVQIGMANQTEAVAITNEVSSTRTLQLIEGFKQDIGVRDAKIAEMDGAVAEGDVRIQRLQKVSDARGEEVQHLVQRMQQVVERERESGEEVAVLKAEVERLKVRVKKGDEIVENQQEFIKQLLKMP